MQIVSFSVPLIDEVLTAGYTQYRVKTGSNSTSAFSTEDGTGTLVAQQMGYDYVDLDGSSATWYAVAYWASGVGTSSLTAAFQGGTIVNNCYCDAQEVRQELAAGATGDSKLGPEKDAVIWRMIEAASRYIDHRKRVGKGAYDASSSTSQRYYPGSGTEFQRVDYLSSLDAVEVEETDNTWTVWTENTDFYAWPYNYSAAGEPIQALEISRKSGSSKSVWSVGPRRIRVAGTFGVASAVPADVKQATIALTTRIYQASQQGYQDAGASMEMGQLILAQAEHPQIKAMIDALFPHVGAGI